MKRVTLNIDLEQNKDFEEGINEAVKAYALQVSREHARIAVEEEVARIVDKQVEKYVKSSDFSEKLRRAVEDVFSDMVRQNNTIVDLMNNRIDRYVAYSHEVAEQKTEKMINDYIKVHFADVLTKYIGEAVKDSVLKTFQNND